MYSLYVSHKKNDYLCRLSKPVRLKIVLIIVSVGNSCDVVRGDRGPSNVIRFNALSICCRNRFNKQARLHGIRPNVAWPALLLVCWASNFFFFFNICVVSRRFVYFRWYFFYTSYNISIDWAFIWLPTVEILW